MLPLVWDDWNIEHIKKHAVSAREVEEAYQSSKKSVQSYLGRTIFLGVTKAGRLLTVVVSQKKQKCLYVVSARNMSKKERRIYYEQAKTNTTI